MFKRVFASIRQDPFITNDIPMAEKKENSLCAKPLSFFLPLFLPVRHLVLPLCVVLNIDDRQYNHSCGNGESCQFYPTAIEMKRAGNCFILKAVNPLLRSFFNSVCIRGNGWARHD